MKTRTLVLLARPGQARDRVQAGLADAGAQVALVLDPADVDAATLGAHAREAGALLVLLEPAVEAALERLEPVFGDHHIDVVFDDAELAARREGWEAARWARHLAAKLHGHDDVLPPGATPAPATSAGVIPASVRVDTPVRIDSPPAERFVDVPAAPSAAPAPAPSFTAPVTDTPALADVGLSLASVEEATPVASGILDVTPVMEASEVVPAPPPLSPSEQSTFRRDIEDIERRASSLSLVDDAAEAASQAPPPGVVLMFAGMGGPDAIRQLLAALPETFPRALAVRQKLDGAQYEKLVRQLQRGTLMPVSLAQPGEALQGGHVYIVGDGVGLLAQDHVLRFAEGHGGEAALLHGLRAGDSAVLMLSGADPSLVDAAMTLHAHGALVAGQSEEGCFAPEAAQAVALRGGESGSPATLAHLLIKRWAA